MEQFKNTQNEILSDDQEVEHELLFNTQQIENLHIAEKQPADNIPTNFIDSPNGTRHWIPDVPDDMKPVKGAKFSSWDNLKHMYESYAEKAGFHARCGQHKRNKSTGLTTNRYMHCSKYGKPKLVILDTSEPSKKKTNIKVTDCPAGIRTRVLKGTGEYEITEFTENHNHGLVSEDNIDLTQKKRKLEFHNLEYVANCQLANLGPVKAHRLEVALKGGHHNVTGTSTDYKNVSRDITKYILDRDAQMFVDKMTERTLYIENYTFEVLTHGREVRSLFWVDDVAKRSYDVFGDVIAFDATYQTNKYNMIFVPFTGVDHHQLCVNFGSGLLYDETTESYTWLLNNFLKAHGKQPSLVLTDQDGAMKAAVLAVLDKSKHRLCMWHITQKLPAKICGKVLNNTEFRAEFNKLVWNVYIKPSTFEDRWNQLIVKYNLQKNKWLADMFQMREDWIPAYYRHLPMCCLMKTTSRCESTNSAFKVNSCHTSTLVRFLLCYDSTLNQQRYTQRKKEHDSATTTPKMETKYPIERHAASIYTREIFREVQIEIQQSNDYCFVATRGSLDGKEPFKVSHQEEDWVVVNEFSVHFDVSDHSATCSCRCFNRIGYLCRHIFTVYKHHNVREIPQQYILDRWRIEALPKSVYSMKNRYGVDQSPTTVLRHQIVENIQQCTNRIRSDLDALKLLDEQVKELKAKNFQDVPEPPNKGKDVQVRELIHHNETGNIVYHPPGGIRNKGCGTNRRLIGPGEKAKKDNLRSFRTCAYCKERVRDHDIRNCPVKKRDEAADNDSTESDAEENEVQPSNSLKKTGRKSSRRI